MTIEQIKRLLKNLFQQLFSASNIQTAQSIKLQQITLANLGKDLSPTQNELGCVETVCTLLNLTFNNDNLKFLSTAVFYNYLIQSPKFVSVLIPLGGDIVISPTGFGNGKMSNGHTGIVLDKGMIASNNSFNSKLEVNYNVGAWRVKYGSVGGFPVVFFRRCAW